ncbi:acyl dehydratase [Georgenia sp. TF02-10]|uniref:MaoC/PaaZ C-terminal domain-containing protein n=1 Tax=Georgenia sp. TF02-10 TaxID=2917725 RepID=UPI001FA6B737|nr:MaoC/PaaZ C-terminal domain-containing protein [Georgenia sp. TF02-10]UNX54391.1 acyl dehydratase [Georgenia sp. TF02-10]
MSAPVRPVLADLEVGQELFRRGYDVDRDRLVRYAGASGDFNPIHYNDRAAHDAGLPGVIAHGMATLGLAGAAVEAWAGDPGAVLDLGARFARPVVVPDPGAAAVEVVGTVGSVDVGAGSVRVDLTVTCAGVAVLTKARALVRLA